MTLVGTANANVQPTSEGVAALMSGEGTTPLMLANGSSGGASTGPSLQALVNVANQPQAKAVATAKVKAKAKAKNAPRAVVVQATKTPAEQRAAMRTLDNLRIFG